MDSQLTVTTLWFLLGFICLSWSRVLVEVNVGKVSCICIPYHETCKNNTIEVSSRDAAGNRYYYKEFVDSITINISYTPKEGECSHYLDKCCIPAEVTTPDTPNNSTPPPPPPTPVTSTTTSTSKPQVEECGIRRPDGVGFRITGNISNQANYGEFPWMVAVLRQDSVVDDITHKSMECGGSIVHPEVILTAAHCVKGKKDLYIRAGEWDTQTTKEAFPTQDRKVKKVITHEGFYAGNFQNDIALLVLDQPLHLNRVVGTLCLPEQDENMDGRNCLVSGWGKDVYGKQGLYQTILKRVEVPVVRKEPCEEALRKTDLGPNYSQHESLICAGGVVEKDACKGDGGAPLVCPKKTDHQVYVQAGIVSFGLDCGTGTPALYANVPYFRKWIDQQIALRN